MDVEAFRDSPAGRVIRVPGQDYWAFVPHPLPPAVELTPDLVGRLSEADRALGELAGLARLLPNPHILIAPFMRREAVLSSQIEGTQASLADLYTYEAAQLPLFPQPPDVKETHNYVRALTHGLERLASLPVSLRLIREVHGELLRDVRGQEHRPGNYRRGQNYIGPPGCALQDATYVPPPASELQACLDALERYFYSDVPPLPLLRLGMIHYQFEAIHPFADGNGRIGRLLIILLLCAWELLPQPLLYLSAFFEAHRQEYYRLLLEVSQRGAWEAWLSFFLQGIAGQSRDATARAARLQSLRETYRERMQHQRAAARLLEVVDLLFARPIVRVPDLAEQLGVSQQTAGRYVATLEAAGILRETTGQARNRVYIADAVYEAITSPIGGQAA